jgi:hypothetical protein
MLPIAPRLSKPQALEELPRLHNRALGPCTGTSVPACSVSTLQPYPAVGLLFQPRMNTDGPNAAKPQPKDRGCVPPLRDQPQQRSSLVARSSQCEGLHVDRASATGASAFAKATVDKPHTVAVRNLCCRCANWWDCGADSERICIGRIESLESDRHSPHSDPLDSGLYPCLSVFIRR